MIQIKNLSFQYYKGSKKVLDGLSFEIQPGTVNVLLGLNGCGKTTLIKTMAGLIVPNLGEILYDGVSLKKISIKDRSKVFSYVAQKSMNSDDFYVKDYLTYGFVNSLKFYESPKPEQLESVKMISQKLKIEHLLDKKMGQLSGGEKQIVTIAVAIIQDTPIIILDEPTSALDLRNQNLVLTVLGEIAKEGKTIILSSHNPNHALFLNANVLLMNNGKIVKYGSSSEIINKEMLKDIYGESLCFSEELPYKEISFKAE